MKEYEVVAAIEAVTKKYYGETSFFTIFNIISLGSTIVIFELL